MADYVQKFPGKISVAGLDSSEPVTAPQFNGDLNGNATTATNSETATAVPATLIPSNTDLNTYRGSAYWGKTFYAGGNNTVQNLPYSNGAGFFLEVLKSGSYSTIQRLSALISEGNKVPAVYTRSVTDTATEVSGTWTDWQEVAEAKGIYPEMEVGEARMLSMRANVSGAGQLGWYKVGTVTVEGLKAIQNTNASYSLFMLVNGANPPGTNNSAARSGVVEIDTAVVSGGQLQLENGYTAIKVLCGNIEVNDFAVAIDSAGTTLTVYMDARENGVGTRTAFSIISEIYGAMSGSAFEFGWEFYGAAAPADAVYVTLTNNASGAEYLSRFAYLFAGDSQTGWWKLGSIKGDYMGTSQNRSCVFLVNGVLSNQGLSTAGETGFLEFDVRKQSATTNAGLSILSGNLKAEEFCVVLSQTEATVYIKLPSQYNAFAVTMLSEDGASANKVAPLFEFDTQYIGASAPSGAQYAAVRNIASRAEADAEGNVITETYATLGELTTAEEALQKGLTAEATARAAAIEDIVDGTTVVGKATSDGSGNNIVSTYATKTALSSGLAGKANTSGIYPNMSVGSATSAGTADGLDLPDAVAFAVLKVSNYYLASKLTDMGYGVFLITVGIKTNSTFGVGGTFSGVVAVDHQASGAGGNPNPFTFSAIIQNPVNLSGEQAILRVRAMSGLGAIMIETLNSSGAVVDADTILSDTPTLSVRKLIAL